jgi:DNA-binding XRE family transcriptional regulator
MSRAKRKPLLPCDTLRGYREQAAMTQQELADILAVSQGYYALMETGACRVSPRVIDLLGWRFGWTIIPQQPRKRSRIYTPHAPNPEVASKAELMAMMALCAYGGEIPAKWRENVPLHRKAIREWMTQFGERRRAA